MSFKRSILVAIATLFTVGMTQVASAGCCDWGVQAPVAYAQTGCGGCGAAAYAPIIYATPIAPQPIAVGCGGCGAPVTCCAASVAVTYAEPVGCGGGCGGGYGGYGGGYGGYGGGYAHPMHHVGYGGGYYHPHMMAPHYYGPRPMMHRPYWRG